MTTRDTAWPDGTPCWIDVMTSDLEASRTFYTELFGWEWEIGDEQTGFYSTARLQGQRVAGAFTMPESDHPPVWSTYLAAADAQAVSDSVVRHGGTVFQPPMDVMGLGTMAVLQDPTSGAFGVWQAARFIGTERFNETGTLIWNELLTRDYDAAREFYSAVFSYTYTEIGDGGFKYSIIEVDGNTVGGLGTLPAEVPAHVPAHWRVYFAVDDADATVDRVTQLGGSVLRPPEDMPYGRHADVADPQGAMFAIIRPVSPPAS